MSKFVLVFIFLCSATYLYAQSDYFEGKRTYCPMPDSDRVKEIFPLGIQCIQKNVYLGSAVEIFTDVIKIDSTFCDAYFWAGYAYRMSDMHKEALIYYYVADSLAQNRSIEFKQNLAVTSMIVGLDSLSRKKYEEIKEFFPESPEGYYGVALTSTLLGDVDYGLENINIAERKYSPDNKDTQFLKAILLTLNARHEDALPYYEKVKGKFGKDDHFNRHYALSLYEQATYKNDEKMLKEAKKYYKKIKNKNELTDETRAKFEN